MNIMNKIDIENLGCFGKARLIVEATPEARIYSVETDIKDEEPVCHAYVLLGDQVLNQDAENLSREDILSRGVDVTKNILRTPWRKL